MEEAPVTALTPDCDPDLSNCGSPSGRPGGGVRSTLVLLALSSAVARTQWSVAMPQTSTRSTPRCRRKSASPVPSALRPSKPE